MEAKRSESAQGRAPGEGVGADAAHGGGAEETRVAAAAEEAKRKQEQRGRWRRR